MSGKDQGHEWIVALALAISLGLAVTLITTAVLYDAIFSEGPGLSDNATQVLTAAFGGIIGVLGSYVGFRAGAAAYANDTHAPEIEAPPVEAPPPVEEPQSDE